MFVQPELLSRRFEDRVRSDSMKPGKPARRLRSSAAWHFSTAIRNPELVMPAFDADVTPKVHDLG
jgi:hypothetical protein